MRIAVALCLFLTTLPAQAEELAMGGYLKSFVFSAPTDSFEFDRVGSRLQLSARGEASDVANYYAAIDFELDSRLGIQGDGDTRGAALDIWPVEAWLNLNFEDVEIKLGQQYIFWGRTTWVTPTDVISGWDYANMASEIEDYRLAPLAARISWYLFDDGLVDFVWVPIATSHRIPMAVPNDMGGIPVTQANGHPEAIPQNGEFGLRISNSYSPLALDWAIAAYKGFEKSPTPIIDPQVPAGAMPPIPTSFIWTNHYGPLWMLGFDLAKADGPFVFKVEAAYKRTDDGRGDDLGKANSRAESVVSVDWTANDDIQLILQYSNKYLLDYGHGEEEARYIAAGAPVPNFLPRKLSHSLSTHLNLKFTESVGAQLLLLASVTNQDAFGLGFIWWQITDSVKAWAGGIGFAGQEDTTPFGRQKDSSRAFVEIKVSF